jgi:competence protein ComFC
MQLSFGNKSVLISKFVNLFYPSECPLCKNSSDNIAFAPFCTLCWSGIKKYSGPSCRICSSPFASEHSEICSACLKKPPLFSIAMSFGIYDGALAEAVNLFKFYGIKRLNRPLGRLLLEFDLTGFDAVVPVPLSLKGLRDRGFNQSLLLAKTVSSNIKVPLMPDRLMKIRETPPQIGLNAKERTANLKGAFRVDGKFTDLRILLIDDVMTTGATADECTKQLLKAGAVEVVVLTLARASGL